MKVTILNERLSNALAVVGRGVASRPQLPVLANVLIRSTAGGVEILSTDLEISFRIKVGAKVREEGEVSVSGRVLSELVGTLPAGPVDLEVDKDSLVIETNGIRSMVAGMASGEYPSIPSFSGKCDIEIGVEELVEEIERVGVAVAKDDARPVLMGVLWKFEKDRIRLVATDGYRLGIGGLRLSVEKEGLSKLILPARALLELVRIVDKQEVKTVLIKFEINKQQVIFKIGEIEIVSRLLAGDFPPFEQIMPESYSTRVLVSREELTEAVKRASIFARESANIVKVKMDNNQLKVSANSPQLGSSETGIDVETEGEEVEMAFNSRYLLEYLGVVRANKVIIESEGSLKPGVFREEGEEWVHIIMPVRVQS